jgi:hypothetical protein
MASLSSLNLNYFENHAGTHLYKHSKPLMTDTIPQKGQMKETHVFVKHEPALFHGTIQFVKSPQQML